MSPCFFFLEAFQSIRLSIVLRWPVGLLSAEDNEPTLEQVLAQLDAVFKKMNVKHAECKKRVVCEAHRPSLNGAPDSRPIRDIIRYVRHLLETTTTTATETISKNEATRDQ